MQNGRWDLVLLLALALVPQDRGPGKVVPSKGDRIAWYGTLNQARSEAKRTGRPILLLSAAPHCHLTPGIW